MKIHVHPQPQSLLNAFMVMFIIHSVQLGVGVQGFQRIIYMDAGHDAWISVALSGVVTCIIGFIMVKTLNYYESSDLYGIQRDVYGKWLGTCMNALYIFYCMGSFLVVMRNYIEVLQAWVFPEVPTWFLSLTLMMLVLYGVLGGFRIIAGVSFFSVFLSLWLLGLLGYPLQFSHWSNLLPILESNATDILKGTYSMTFTVIGFELIYSFYPFIKEKKKVQMYMQIGLLYTSLLYVAIMLVTLSYFSGGQLERTIWGTLSLFKIVRLPFIERFEYVAITFWMLLILPNLMLYLWSASRGLTRMFGEKRRRGFILALSFILFGCIQLFVTRQQINQLNNVFAQLAFFVVYCYPVFLFLIVWLKKKVFRKEVKS
ncbi:spore germination protein [Rossellomorea vietnamensis]|uniref:GerAB/ArcD/ProY family transporter n=1 Tax=Rossellomorea TaxID=2837508 RepID=UPI001CCAC314|nr:MULTISPECIES: GerAB/ArcD/ProY family transporter [Rossellomorea]MCA0149608.1 spore germination protein [Rossellomorea vietnamensis]UTE78549.1 spore germination protein [Rossellomorea sp. KS-H15a]